MLGLSLDPSFKLKPSLSQVYVATGTTLQSRGQRAKSTEAGAAGVFAERGGLLACSSGGALAPAARALAGIPTSCLSVPLGGLLSNTLDGTTGNLVFQLNEFAMLK